MTLSMAGSSPAKASNTAADRRMADKPTMAA